MSLYQISYVIHLVLFQKREKNQKIHFAHLATQVEEREGEPGHDEDADGRPRRLGAGRLGHLVCHAQPDQPEEQPRVEAQHEQPDVLHEQGDQPEEDPCIKFVL